jgi:DNA polymerase-1
LLAAKLSVVPPTRKVTEVGVPPKPELSVAKKPSDPNRIFLIDAMSFIFRAYHAMARQRGMSTKSGVPTAAVYVFVNMLRKLRDDFSPQYLAAVFDVAAPTFRDQQAEAFTSVRKFDVKSQTFQQVEYHGYKANRSEMPGDLAQQIPYIRRAFSSDAGLRSGRCDWHAGA